MPQCKYCGKKSIFLTVSKLGLCQPCHTFIAMDVGQKMRIIQESAHIIDNSKNMSTRISRWKLLMEHLHSLVEYEDKGIHFWRTSTPSQLIRQMSSKHAEIVLEGVKLATESAMAKAEIATSAKARITAASKALLTINEAKAELHDNPIINETEERIKLFIHKTTLDDILEKARKAEYKGQIKKALDQYKEALFYLHNDEYDDNAQIDQISEIEDKVRQLEG